MSSLVELLFKYRPIVFANGHIVLATSWPTRLAVLLVGAAAVATVATYTKVRVRGTPADRVVLGGMRVLALALLVFALLRPVLLVSAAAAHGNVVGVLIDDSRSMRVADMDGRTRADVVRSLLGLDSAVYKALADRFTVRFFRVGDGGGHVPGVSSLPFDAPRTRLGPALEGVRQELAGVPLAGIVLASDGGDEGRDSLGQTLVALGARHVPVFALGVGRERFARDIEVGRVEGPRVVLKGAALVLQVGVSQRGFGGSDVQLVVEDGGRIVATQRVTLPKDGEATTIRVRVPAAEPGPHLFTARIAPQPGELVRENNAQSALVVVQDRPNKILYVEGEPRSELPFIRRALARDDNLRLVAMLRTTRDKFFRLGVDSAPELVDGFPRTREDLFAYRGIVLGSIEASFFTPDQLRMISDFVSERGGGLLMLGGRTSFAEGGYAGTPVADALPVELDETWRGKPALRQVRVGLTPAGTMAAETQIAGSESESAKRWPAMPVVTSVNHVTRVKPGASTLLDGAPPRGGARTAVLTSQRYGRGKAIAFPIQDSWLWQMRADTPVEDATYTTFWRQMLRWLVSDVPDRVAVGTATDRAWVDEPLQIGAEVRDAAYRPAPSAQTRAVIHAPSGATIETALDPAVTRDGAYQAAFTPTERGVYRIQVTARLAGESPITSEPTFVDVGSPSAEFTGAELRGSLLRRIAEETGGRYYTPETASGLAKDLVYAGGGMVTAERLDLWDMPVILLLLILLLGGEWGYRRARGLA